MSRHARNPTAFLSLVLRRALDAEEVEVFTPWTGQPRLSERVAALVHFSSPSNYYRARFDTQRQALIASGYLLEVKVPLPDLRSRLTQVRISLSNAVQRTGADYEAKRDDTRNEVRLLCRKEDVSLWQRTLS